MKESILILSGGLDSTVLLYDLLYKGHAVKCLSIDYGQRHSRELEFASNICSLLKVDHEIADLRGITKFLAGSSQTDPTIGVPVGHYEEETMKLTVIPNRNLLMLSLAMSWAISLKFENVAYGAHKGDRAVYPDCRIEFVEEVQKIAKLVDWHEINLLAPFVEMSKTDIAILGKSLNVPFEKTWSCYSGGDIHCSVCGTCSERRMALLEAGVNDKTEYALPQLEFLRWAETNGFDTSFMKDVRD